MENRVSDHGGVPAQFGSRPHGKCALHSGWTCNGEEIAHFRRANEVCGVFDRERLIHGDSVVHVSRAENAEGVTKLRGTDDVGGGPDGESVSYIQSSSYRTRGSNGEAVLERGSIRDAQNAVRAKVTYNRGVTLY